MSRRINYYTRAIKLLQELHSEYPSYSIAQHLSTALADYGDYWGITDKEFCFAIEKYQSELALDAQNIAPQAYVEKVIKDAEDLFSEKEEEEEDGY